MPKTLPRLSALLCLALPASAQEVEGAEVALRLEDPRIYESSGLALSRRHPAVLWTHNDSGDEPRLYAVGSEGRTLATLTLAGVEARDWEALAAGRDARGRPALFVGDIGDNQGVWPDVSVYRVAEPAQLRDATVPAVRYRLRYADGSHNAEALLVDPRSNRLYVATKSSDGGGLYRAPGRRVGSFELPAQFQGESITVTADGRSVLAGSEGPESEVWRVPLPESALAQVTPTTRPPPTTSAPTTPEARDRGATPFLVAAAALILVTAVTSVLVIRRRS